ncbi:MAG: Hsp70 family protein [Synergistaceae bacterium]|jgi:molecular chaperone DnaK (HSP70)|nr:Hsp70 family protein [Synergistaceae bacterium]
MKIGIDFGTSFSLPAGIINGTPSTLLPNGEYGIPSVFYYDSEVGVQIGTAADDNANFQPLNVKRDIKMEISTHADSFVADGKTFSKKQIIGHIFKEITRVSRQEGARRELVSQSIDGAVVSVPAAFTLRELNFIREAAQMPEASGGAGLNVLGFIREPVAAAIAYFNAPNAEDERTILVYDLGGGTCDVAIVRSDRNSNEWYKVINSDMKRIGGRDWDKILIDMIKRKYQEKAGRINFDAEAEGKIRKQAIAAKHILSGQQNARVSVNISGKTHSCVITADEFERATSEILQSTMDIVSRMVRNCNTKIDYIVCVGGSSNMPQVKKMFEETYPVITVKLFEPEKAIAFGAAIYAEHLTEAQYLSDICKFSYGAKYIDDFETYHDKNRFRIINIIFKGSTLPVAGTSCSSPIRDNQSSSYLPVFESECTDKRYLPENGTYIGDIRISGLEGRKKTDSTILTISIDQSGLMSLKAVDEKSGKTATVEIQLKNF